MRTPLSWIRDFTPAEGPPDEIARILSFLGLVVEATEHIGAPPGGIVVARVLATRAHPAADRIQLVDVDAGDGEATQICCGAFNMKPGDLVPLATIGTVMPSGMEISRRKLRGEWSNGMLCSGPELGLGPEGPVPAIFLLPPGIAPPGQPVSDALGLSPDVVFDLEISPNRSDCFSVAGVARDLAAAMRQPFSVPVPPHVVDRAVEPANVAVDHGAVDLCPRLTGTVIEGVQGAAPPPSVRRRLILAGMRPISPVVDVSNYVMLELGQPNHAYDIGQLGGRGLRVRGAAPGETIITLDGVKRVLSPGDCVVADFNGAAVGLAGIMGGAGAEISPGTVSILLEMANFDPRAISATGKRLGLTSEARTRFERGVDIELPPGAIDRFVELLGPGVRRGDTVDVRAAAAVEVKTIVRTDRVNLLLGTALRPDECAAMIAPLGFEAVPEPRRPGGGPDHEVPGGEAQDRQAQDYEVTVPTWRPDCRREVDIIEEIARIYGYENISRALPRRSIVATGLTSYQKGRRRVREVLAGAGASEAWTTSFISAADLAQAGLEPSAALELENPLDQSQGWLRTSLLPGLLRAARFNTERQAGTLNLFELGSVFRRPAPDEAPAPGGGDGPPAAGRGLAMGPQEGLIDGVVEQEELGLVAVGPGAGAAHAARTWEVLCAGLRLLDASVEPFAPGGHDGPAGGDGTLAAVRPLHPGRRARVVVAGRCVGALGELAPEVAARYDLMGTVSVILIDLAALLGAPTQSGAAHPVSRYPAADLDVAFLVDEGVPAGDLGQTVRQAAGDLAESIALFDVWRDGSLPAGSRSLAFRLRLRSPDRTLTEQQVAEVRTRVADAALQRHGAVLRGG